MIYINIKRDEPIFQVRRVDRNINIHSMGKRGLQGEGVPTGGTSGQVLTKDSSSDFDTSWQDAGAGDMQKSTYDPTGVEGDAFNRSNHAGTQPASTISDFDVEVSNNTDVSANTAARHAHTNKTTLDAITAPYTIAEQTKLAGIAAGAEVNVNSDWSAVSGDALILNKPTIPDSLDDLTGSLDNIAEGSTNKHFTNTEKTKLSGIETGAEVNNISDADVTDLTDGGATTLHKHSYNTLDDLPNIPTQYTDEMAQDAVGSILLDSAELDFTYNDVTPSITAVLKTGSIDETKLDASVNASLDLADSAIQNLAGLGITATASEINTLDGILATVTELNFVDGVTSSIQTQLDGKFTLQGANVVNELGLDIDQRFEGDNDSNLLFLDASTDRIGVGTNTPAQKLHVIGNYQVDDAVSATKGYRFRTNGAALDLDFGATSLYLSGFQNADYTGNQYTHMILSAGGNWIDIISSIYQKRFGDNQNVITTENGVVFNEQGVDVDFRVEGDTDTNLLFVDASTDRVGIGTATPQALFDVDGTARVITLNISGTDVTATAAELNILDGATLTVTELNFVDGVTSAIQTQLDNKQPLDADLTTLAGLTATTDNFIVAVSSAWASRTPSQVRTTLGLVIGTNVQAYSANLDEYAGVNPTTAGLALLDDVDNVAQLITLGLTATASEINTLDGITATTAELNILDGVTATASELNALDGITATVTELNYTDGVTSAIQTQLDAKQALDSDLTAIAGLSPTNDDIIQRKSGAWTNRTMAQLKTDLSLNNVDNTSDATKNSAVATLTNKQYQLAPAPSSDTTANGLIVTLTANENQGFGDVCYINSDGEAQLGDADAETTSRVVAMAIASNTANNAGSYLLQGFARNDAWAWTVGGFIYLSTTGTTGNTLTQTAPSATDDAVVVIGVATHADRMYFNPQLVIVERT